MDAVKLHNKYTIEELTAMGEKIKQDPNNQQSGFYVYTKSARRKLDSISWAITYHLQDSRRARGEAISTGEGYTGKKQN